MLKVPHPVYIQQEYFHRVVVHVFKGPQQRNHHCQSTSNTALSLLPQSPTAIFCLCKLNYNKNGRQSCIRREQSELQSMAREGQVFRLADQPLILEKIGPKSKIDWRIFKEFEQNLQEKL